PDRARTSDPARLPTRSSNQGGAVPIGGPTGRGEARAGTYSGGCLGRFDHQRAKSAVDLRTPLRQRDQNHRSKTQLDSREPTARFFYQTVFGLSRLLSGVGRATGGGKKCFYPRCSGD